MRESFALTFSYPELFKTMKRMSIAFKLRETKTDKHNTEWNIPQTLKQPLISLLTFKTLNIDKGDKIIFEKVF